MSEADNNIAPLSSMETVSADGTRTTIFPDIEALRLHVPGIDDAIESLAPLNHGQRFVEIHTGVDGLRAINTAIQEEYDDDDGEDNYDDEDEPEDVYTVRRNQIYSVKHYQDVRELHSWVTDSEQSFDEGTLVMLDMNEGESEDYIEERAEHTVNIVCMDDMSPEFGNTETIPICFLEELSTEQEKEVKKAQKQKKLFDKGVMKKTDKEIIPLVSGFLDELFPNNWEITVFETNIGGLGYRLMLRFPEITITNNGGNSHDLKDLFIKLEFNPQFILINKMEGLRMHYTWPEYNSQYRHSHLPRHPQNPALDTWAVFCLGASELSAIQTEWQLPDRTFDIIEFELWMYQIDAYTKWQSDEGGPYIKINTISAGSVESSLNIQQKESGYGLFKMLGVDFPLAFNPSTKKFQVPFKKLERQLTQLFEGYVSNFCKTDGINYIYECLDYKEIAGKIKIANTNPLTFTFRGETITRKVEEYLNPLGEDNLVTVVYPDITKYIQNQLEIKTNYYFIKNYGK